MQCGGDFARFSEQFALGNPGSRSFADSSDQGQRFSPLFTMPLPVPRLSAPILLAQLAMALAVCLLAQAVAQASCGDYVVIRHFQSNATPSGLAQVAISSRHTPAAPRPCSGAFCTKAPRTHSTPPPIERLTSGGKWGSLAALDVALNGSPSVRFSLAERAAQPLRTSARIFHPPRSRAIG